MNPSRRILLSGLGGLALLSACGRRDEASAGGEGLTDPVSYTYLRAHET